MWYESLWNYCFPNKWVTVLFISEFLTSIVLNMPLFFLRARMGGVEELGVK